MTEKTTIETNYSVEALKYLLVKECLIERYYPLIPLKNELISRSRKMGCRKKDDIARLSDPELLMLGLQDEGQIRLLRRFLKIYDPNPQKFKEIEKADIGEEEYLAFRELYYLPGVKQTRASLYYQAGYTSLKAIAGADPEEILQKTALTIAEKALPCIVPLPKEVRTHIAVAKAFTQSEKE